MAKIYIKIAILLAITGLHPSLYASLSPYNDLNIVVDISEQRLYLLDDQLILYSYPISSSKYGEGSTENSFKTPLGMHEIKRKIGDDAKLNSIFVARTNTNMCTKTIDVSLYPHYLIHLQLRP